MVLGCAGASLGGLGGRRGGGGRDLRLGRLPLPGGGRNLGRCRGGVSQEDARQGATSKYRDDNLKGSKSKVSIPGGEGDGRERRKEEAEAGEGWGIFESRCDWGEMGRMVKEMRHRQVERRRGLVVLD